MAESLKEKFDELLAMEGFAPKRHKKTAEDPSVIKLANLIITQAVIEKASDIHIEPERDSLRVRYRIDGVLDEVLSISQEMRLRIVPSIEVAAGLAVDAIERSKPQDGRIAMTVEGKEVDLRISTFPTLFGDKVAIRVLDKSLAFFELDQLGLSPYMFEKFRIIIRRPNGLIFVTGPAGCGKTTTLYSALNTINSPELNIITLEDPIEYQIEGINQGQINPKLGLTFSDGLRSILRQDPNIILVGEIRDVETAEIAIRASLTGHLVFTTLHTNDAPGSITRLLDMGIEPFLISSSVVGILSQRLVRTICNDCKVPYSPLPELLNRLNLPELPVGVTFYKGIGCPACRFTGYRGRTGIFELMVLNDHLRALILNKSLLDEIRKSAYYEAGMKSLREDGMDKVLNGITTVEDILRVTREE